VTSHRLLNYLLLALICAVFIQCSNPRLIAPAPHLQGSGKQTENESPEQEPKSSSDNEIDFADAFDLTIDPAQLSSQSFGGLRPSSSRYPYFDVKRSSVRVAIIRNVKDVNLYSVGTVDIRAAGRTTLEPFRGRLAVRPDKSDNTALLSASWGSRIVSLPCTLLSRGDYNFIEAGQGSYRGSVILVSEKKNCISVINYLDVEDYLRGVVPLEIGKRSEKEIEALKAQAVAARTYTYRRILESKGKPYDLLCTVADQVYGGANVETRESDLAVKQTRNLVMVYNDSLITAYYHSTCGGYTANIENVWDKPPCNYLRSIKDTDSLGRAYCRISPAFEWEEKWSKPQFSSMVAKASQGMGQGSEFRGNVTDFRIEKVFPCGRISLCTIRGGNSEFKSGRDQVRFILRRTNPENSILRSSSFKVVSIDKTGIKISGRGYGHGVGMCQMGAVGRALVGLNFEQILKAYYTGVTICTAAPEDRIR